MSTNSQCSMILKHLRGGSSITPMQALKMYSCMRLGARVYDLKQAGHRIKGAMVEYNGKRFKKYWM